MLGHSSATMTLDTRGHLFENRLDEVGNALDLARRAVDLPVRRKAHGETPPNPAVAQTLPNEGVIDLATYRSKGKTAGHPAVSDGAPGRIRTCATASGEPPEDDVT